MRDINWAVLGTGVIANEMAVALKKNGKNIYAVGNRTYEKAVLQRSYGRRYCERGNRRNVEENYFNDAYNSRNDRSSRGIRHAGNQRVCIPDNFRSRCRCVFFDTSCRSDVGVFKKIIQTG